MNHGGGKSQPKFHYCWYQYICDGTNKTPDVPAQANPEQERSIETNLEETTFQPDSSLKDQLQSNAVKSNLTNVNPSFGSLCRIFVFQKANLPKISLDIT